MDPTSRLFVVLASLSFASSKLEGVLEFVRPYLEVLQIDGTSDFFTGGLPMFLFAKKDYTITIEHDSLER